MGDRRHEMIRSLKSDAQAGLPLYQRRQILRLDRGIMGQHKMQDPALVGDELEPPFLNQGDKTLDGFHVSSTPADVEVPG